VKVCQISSILHHPVTCATKGVSTIASFDLQYAVFFNINSYSNKSYWLEFM